MPKAKLVTIGGLWRKESGGAGVFYTGKIGRIPDGIELKEGAKLFIFENRKPAQEKSPTHHLMTEDTRPSGSGGDPGPKRSDPPMGFEGYATPEDKAPW